MKNIDYISDAYLKIREFMENPNSNIEEFNELVSSDAGISSMVLRIANHEIFGLKGQVVNIDQAINLLGIGQICEMVLEVNQILPMDQIVSTKYENNIIQFPARKSWQTATLCA
jgi:HD-like signal output (HDOD) protein